jgi:hypothetical protein
MDQPPRPEPPAAAEPAARVDLPPKTPTPKTRIALALLDVYTAANERRGYDPYDTSGSKPAADPWSRTRKRA